MLAKDKYLGNENSAKQQALQREIDNLCNENEKFRKRNKDFERQVEDLLRENEKLRKRFKDKDDMDNELEDELSLAKSDIKKLRLLNDDLYRKMQEYKEALEAKGVEISILKDKLN